MITLGIALRNLPIPKPYLAVLYTTIGGALFLGKSSILWLPLAYRREERIVPTASRDGRIENIPPC